MKSLIPMLCVPLVLSLAGATQAGTITSYNINRTQPSGFGNWAHSYSGSIVNNGDGTSAYSGGSGTLNDGIIGSSELDTQLFQTNDNSRITLFLDQSYTGIANIRLYSISGTINFIPGNITSVDVTIDGLTQTISATGFGPPSGAFTNSHELLLTGLSLQNKTDNKIELSNFQTTSFFAGYFSISEITFDGTAVQAVPEPASIAIWSIGAFGCCLVSRRKKWQKA